MGALALPLSAFAQVAGKIFQIGYLGNSSPSKEATLVDAFRQGLREHGYIEGKNIVIHYRWAEGKNDPFAPLIAELIALNVEALVISGTPVAFAAKKASTTTPIVLAAVGDAVGTGIIPSLARPGGNITGLTTLAAPIEGKKIQILQELIPKLRRLALLVNPDNPLTPPVLKSALAAAQALNISVREFDVHTGSELQPALDTIAKARFDALIVLPDRSILSARGQVIQTSERHRLPTMYPFSEFVDDGGLVFYGPNFADMFRRSASYVDKILKGAKPGDLPVEQPTKFELVINRKTAKALGLKLPNSILVQATKVIE